jgi:hypothetical protein
MPTGEEGSKATAAAFPLKKVLIGLGILAAVLVIAAVVVGAVVGTQANKKSTTGSNSNGN